MVAAGWLLRAWPVLRFGNWWRVPADYDDAVYFTASAMLWQGELLYRDFVYVHPPGLVLFVAPIAGLVSSLGATQAFSLARWLMTIVGAANIALTARVAHRAAGPVAATMAAIAYAVSPEAVLHERSTYTEPVLNLACLLFANQWLATSSIDRSGVGAELACAPRTRLSRGRALGAGLALGMALTVKAWAAAWVVACIVAAPPALGAASPDRRALMDWRSLMNLALGAAIAISLLAVPFLIAAPGPFLEQTVAFQLSRPPDGMGRIERASSMLLSSWPIVLLAAVGLMAAVATRDQTRRRSARFFGAAWLLVMLAFLLGPTFWPDYNSHLAAAQAPLAGLGAAWLWSTVATRNRGAKVAIAALLVAALFVPLRRTIVEGRVGGDLMERIGAQVRALPSGECYAPFEPLWGLAGDRLPSIGGGREPLVDVYATMLVASRSGGRGHLHASEVMRRRAPQERIRELIADCEHLSLGLRGREQLTPRTLEWIERRWELVTPPSETSLDLWRLRR